MIRLSIVFLVFFCGIVICDECEPDLADSCFESIEEHVKYLIDVKNDIIKNITQAAIHDFCLSIEDSIHCASDVIDEDCSDEEGRGRFDTWLLSLRATYNFVCQGDHSNLKGVLQGINCWNVEDFVLCTMEQADIQHVRDFLNKKMDEHECDILKNVMSQCYKSAMSGSCREQKDMSILVGGMISSFFTPYGCIGDQSTVSSIELHSSSMHIIFNKYLLYACVILLKFYWTA
ncbi:uncharacterized protein [Parasteatoda tepidariorum]|uniref:uncharacterized protein n=1 Tax=Parasteatoda tepidariorum TaxID=114398 RepID=UPI00077F8890|nr:uncharacterized protein LOC107440191 [Parasteatoda tepidariorum]